MIAIRMICLLAAVAAVAFTQPAGGADGFPGKTVRLMVAFPPGGGQDLVARLLAPKLDKSIGRTVVVENSSGGAGFVGILSVTRAKADGSYLLINTMGMSVNAAMYRQLPYDAHKDVEPTALIGTTPFYFAVNPKLGFNSMQDFLSAARASPGKYKGASFANSTGVATIELLRQRAGIDVQTVPYRGVAPAAAAVISGEADFLMVDGASILPFIESGRLRGLAVAAKSRDPDRPQLSTMIEAGVPDFIIDSWFGIFVKGGTPMPVVTRWNQEINNALEHADVREKLKSIGMTPAPASREAFAKRYNDDILLWKSVVEKGKLPPLE